MKNYVANGGTASVKAILPAGVGENDTEPTFDPNAFKTCDWSEFYPDDAEEPMPPMMPQERGHGVVTSCFVDADHAGC